MVHILDETKKLKGEVEKSAGIAVKGNQLSSNLSTNMNDFRTHIEVLVEHLVRYPIKLMKQRHFHRTLLM